MKITKVLSALLLLISGHCFSFTPLEYPVENIITDEKISHNLDVDFQQVYDSNLSAQLKLSIIPFESLNRNFQFYSDHSQRIAENYINSSCLITPGLDITKIIFPFHSFL